MNDDMIAARLQALKGPYLEQLRVRVDSLTHFMSMIEHGTLKTEDRAELQFLAHKLAGTGATYGYAAISETGRALELWLQSRSETAPELLQLIQKLAGACQAALSA